jgi:hypothetical protein
MGIISSIAKLLGIKPIIEEPQDVPSIVKSLNKLLYYHRDDKANCWNATLLYYGVESEIKYTPPGEIELFLHHKCTYVSEPKCNDMFIIRSNDGELVHTAVLVSPGLFWHKKGIGGKWEFISEKDIKIVYPGIYSYARPID